MIDLVFSAPKGRDPASGGKNYTDNRAPRRSFFEKILETSARELKIKENFSISVNLVIENKIKELNRKYRNKDKATDVLSFPLKEKLEIENWKLKIEEDIGDIFLCLSIAKNDAKRENISIKQKLAQLTVHGFLHLLGYDHEKSKHGAKKMFSLENKILDKIKV